MRMNQENKGHKKLVALILLLLLLLVGIGLFLSWLKPSKTSDDIVESSPGFASFDRPTTDRAINVHGDDTPFPAIARTVGSVPRVTPPL